MLYVHAIVSVCLTSEKQTDGAVCISIVTITITITIIITIGITIRRLELSFMFPNSVFALKGCGDTRMLEMYSEYAGY